MPEVKERPEAVDLATKLWLGVMGCEALHQLLNVITSLLNIGELKSQAKQTMSAEQIAKLGDPQLTVVAVFSVIAAGFLAMIVLGIVGWTAYQFRSGSKRAEKARRFLTIFAIYFVFRGLVVFELAEVSPAPVALLLLDGSAQLLVAVLAVLAALLGGKKESVAWARATADQA